MKTHCLAIACIALSSLSVAEASLKSDIEGLNKSIEAAMKKRDMNAFVKLVKPTVTPDFKYSEPGGKPMGFDAMVAGMKQGFSMYTKITKAYAKVVSAKEHGDMGTAVEKQVMEGLTSGPDKKPHKMVYEGTSTETYKKVDGKWKMTSMIMKTDKMTLDGKPMPMGGG